MTPPSVLSRIERPWRDPVEAAAALSGLPGRLCLLTGGDGGRWSYVAAAPTDLRKVPVGASRSFDLLRGMTPGGTGRLSRPDDPPFMGGVVGLAAYDLCAPAAAHGPDPQDWPGLILGAYPRLLAFDHERGRVLALGLGADANAADQAAEEAAAWLERPSPRRAAPSPLAAALQADRPDRAYRDAVADVTGRIAAGEIFQANIARAWSGSLNPEAEPFDLFVRLAGESPAPYAAFWDLGEHALVSNSPEAFLALDDGAVTTRPIKGTRPRGADPATDAALRRELSGSAKDRAENLMIVDLMRNDLSRVCEPGSVTAPALWEAQSYANVHHLVSTVRGRLAADRDAADLLDAAFPPGSITGAPKRQAMKVIAGHEAGRGPWCGSLFALGADGGLTASVLIRTVAFRREHGGWSLRTLAGAGIVADSDPEAELAETEAKIAAIRRALLAPAAAGAGGET